MKKIAVIFYGAPGSGKGTQADLLTGAMDIFQFDIGSLVEGIIYEPKNKNNKIIQKQRDHFEAGRLMDPLWVAKVAEKRIREISKAGLSIVLSGSLRTTEETFGKGTKHGLLDVFEQEYGKKNIVFFLIQVTPAISVKRNSGRLICVICGRPLVYEYAKGKIKKCLTCGGKFRKRTLDKPDIIKKRVEAYKDQTAPVFKELKKRGYKIIQIDGAREIYKVHQDVMRKLKAKL